MRLKASYLIPCNPVFYVLLYYNVTRHCNFKYFVVTNCLSIFNYLTISLYLKLLFNQLLCNISGKEKAHEGLKSLSVLSSLTCRRRVIASIRSGRVRFLGLLPRPTLHCVSFLPTLEL